MNIVLQEIMKILHKKMSKGIHFYLFLNDASEKNNLPTKLSFQQTSNKWIEVGTSCLLSNKISLV